ncbi:MAG: methyltransferase domain-containing protein [Anaerolineae bacterium]
MSLWAWAALVAAVAVIGALLYWQLVLAEGVYLGQRIVTLMYDWSARSYDRIKGFDEDDEADRLGYPLAERLAEIPAARVLDVATGTGRLPLVLLQQTDFSGEIVALDASAGMLAQAQAKLAAWDGRITFLCHDATTIPFPDASFDAVTCLEALEFLASPEAALREMLRVLRPGGTLLITQRVGVDRLYFPGRVPSREAFDRHLADLGLTDLRREVWQAYYDLIWAVKPVSQPDV